MIKVGVDIGGTDIKIGLVDGCNVIKSIAIKTKKNLQTREFVKYIADSIRELACDVQFDGIGIGFPGLCDEGIVSAINLNIIEENLSSMFLDEFNNIEVKIDNDAKVAAIAELEYGSLKDSNNAIFITLGTGIGGAIIIDKKIYRGSFNAAGEIGHQIIEKDGIMCACGNRGCFEAYGSTNALVERAKKSLINNTNSVILGKCNNNLENLNAKMIFEAYDMEDELAQNLIDEHIKYIGIGINNLINIFDVDSISIGGGISKRCDVFLDKLIDNIEEMMKFKRKEFKCKIVSATFVNDAGLIGAASLVADKRSNDEKGNDF